MILKNDRDKPIYRGFNSSIIIQTVLAPVVRKVDSSIHRINHYPVDSVIGFPNSYPLDRDLSGG